MVFMFFNKFAKSTEFKMFNTASHCECDNNWFEEPYRVNAAANSVQSRTYSCTFLVRLCLFTTIYKAGGLSPPHGGGGNGNLKIISPPYFETLGGKFSLFPPHVGGKCPPQAENFEDLEIWNAKFPLQKCISASQILKIFRLRRAIFMLGFLYKIYCSDWNPKKFRLRRATLCVFIIGLSRIQRANRFVNSRSAFCAS